ncbi:hypothetical protein AAFP35_04945 [Gordonia sp. CPCC 206044]|uniref:WXG100 family type VII secretion target n=1 Tax=Gordonia sp. CPCC 206044 TaxID=3140793 RepID=UPI003AF39972
MSGGDNYKDYVNKNPFKAGDRTGKTKADTPYSLGKDVSPDGNTVFGHTERWDDKKWFNIYYPSNGLKPNSVREVGKAWDDIARLLEAGFKDMKNGMESILGSQWSGPAAAAADQVTKAYVAKGHALESALDAMSSNLNGLSDYMDVTKNNLPRPEEVRKYVYDTINSDDIDDSDYHFADVSLEGEQGLKMDVCCDSAKPYFDPIFKLAEESADESTRTVMTSTFDPGLTNSDKNIPAFIGADDPPPTPSPVPGSPSTGPGPGSGSPSGMSGGPGATSTPNLGQNTKLPTSTHPTTPNSPSTTSNPLSNMTSGLQQASSLGQNALSQAQNAAKQAMSGIDKAKEAALKTTPAGLSALQKAAQAKLKGHGGGGAGGGGGLKSGGGAGGLGAKALDALSKEGTLAKGLKDAAAVERAMTGGRGASASGMGGPMGAGGAGAKGGGGEDKEHKANKFLRTTRNGEAILGEPIKAVPVVLKE